MIDEQMAGGAEGRLARLVSQATAPICATHWTPMLLRDPNGMTPEQAFCVEGGGRWWSATCCTSSVIELGSALRTQQQEQLRRIDVDYAAMKPKQQRKYLETCSDMVRAHLMANATLSGPCKVAKDETP